MTNYCTFSCGGILGSFPVTPTVSVTDNVVQALNIPWPNDTIDGQQLVWTFSNASVITLPPGHVFIGEGTVLELKWDGTSPASASGENSDLWIWPPYAVQTGKLPFQV